MGLKDKLSKAVDEHGDRIGGAAEKAGKLINEKTGGKYADKIDSAVGKAKDALDGLDGQNDDIADETAPVPAEPASPDDIVTPGGHGSGPEPPDDTGSEPGTDSAPPVPTEPPGPGAPEPDSPPDPDVQPSSTPDGPQTIPSPSTPEGEPGPDPGPSQADSGGGVGGDAGTDVPDTEAAVEFPEAGRQ